MQVFSVMGEECHLGFRKLQDPRRKSHPCTLNATGLMRSVLLAWLKALFLLVQRGGQLCEVPP